VKAIARRTNRARPKPPDAIPAAGWVLPFWLERQRDPRSPSFVSEPSPDAVVGVAAGAAIAPANLTNRNWTTLSALGSPHQASVDQRGLVTVGRGDWSLDWWVGGEDRWHLPSREAAVRQSLVDGTPVVETVMRVPGGDAVQRVYAIAAAEPLAVIEITNRSTTPFALAMAIRPYGPAGLGGIDTIDLDDAGEGVSVNGRLAVVLPRRPQRMTGSTFTGGDSARHVFDESAPSEWVGAITCSSGFAQAAFVFPIAHTATFRCAIPLEPPAISRGRAPLRVRSATIRDLPASDAAVRGWIAQTDNRGMRLVVPEGRVASAVDANRRYLLVFHGDATATAGAGVPELSPGAASVLRALEDYGFSAERDEVAAAFGSPPGSPLAPAGDKEEERDVVPVDVDGLGPAVFRVTRDTGLSPALTLQRAYTELAACEERCLERLAWMLDVATPTFTWPGAIHPSLGSGCAGAGHDPAVAAMFVSFVRSLLVREEPGGLVLCSMLPHEWRGQSIEVHDAPTSVGLVSFAVRWHGARPALLWDVRPSADEDGAGAPAAAIRLRAPGLDPGWSTEELRGDALLADPAATRSDGSAVASEPKAETVEPPPEGASFS